MMDHDQLYTALRNADAAGDAAGAQKLAAYIKSLPAQNPAPATASAGESLGSLASIGAGLGKGFGQVALGAQNLVGKGLSAIGADQAGKWLQDDAAAGQTKLAGELAPYQAAHPYLSGAGELGGQIVATLPVGGVVAKGAVAIPGVASAAPNLLQAIRTAGMSAGATPGLANALTRAAGGAITGGATASLVNPDQAASGAAVGAALPGALKVVGAAGGRIGSALKAAAEPFYDGGKQLILGRALNTAAGQDAPEVINALKAAAQPFVGPSQPGMSRTMMGEIVPGSVPTTAQAAGNPGIAALSRSATATSPDVTNAISEQIARQNAARVAQLDNLAGADGARDFAAANRDATAEQLYGKAYAKGIPNLSPEQLQNVSEFASRFPPDVTALAKRLAQLNGAPLDDTTSLQGLHWTKKALDGLIAKESGPGGNASLLRAYTGLKNDLVEGMGNLSPDYDVARQVYQQMSVPVNQMDTLQAVRDKSVDALRGNLQPAAFAKAVSDKTAQRATGFNGATLENTLEPRQLNMLQALLEDVRRADVANNAGRGVGSDTAQKLAYSNLLEQSGMPTLLRQFAPAQVLGNLAARGADVAYGGANRELSNRLAQLMLDPEGAAAAMQAARSAAGAPLLRVPGAGRLRPLAYRSAPVLAADR